EQAPVSPGDFRQSVEPALRRGSPQKLGLIVHSRIPILDVQRIRIHDGAECIKTQSQQQALRHAVPGSEGKIADAEKDRAPAVDLEWLHDVRVMADYGVRAAVDGGARLLA